MPIFNNAQRIASLTITCVAACLSANGCASSVDDAHTGEGAAKPTEIGFIKPRPEESAKLLTEKFVEVKDVDMIPPACKSAFAKTTGESSFALANPNSPYQSTDVVQAGPRLPWRRLIYGGTSSDRCVLYYETGGIAKKYAALVIDISLPGSGKLIWGGVDGLGVSSFDSLISQVTSGGFKKNESNRW